jgi:hypothetical protein
MTQHKREGVKKLLQEKQENQVPVHKIDLSQKNNKAK